VWNGLGQTEVWTLGEIAQELELEVGEIVGEQQVVTVVDAFLLHGRWTRSQSAFMRGVLGKVRQCMNRHSARAAAKWRWNSLPLSVSTGRTAKGNRPTGDNRLLRRPGGEAMHQPQLVGSDVHFHPEAPLLVLLGLMHLRIAPPLRN
jgi:hypothetical protein